MRIRNNTTRRVSIGSLNVSLNAYQTADVNTGLAMSSAELQAFIDSGVIGVISFFSSPGTSPLDSFVKSESDEGTLDPADVTDLTDGGDSTLHYHASDRARSNHTGTQLKATISDFAHGSSSHTGAIGTLSQISDVTISITDLNSLDDGVNSTLHFHDSDRARANHTGTQTKSTISDFAHGASDHTGAIGTLSQISDVTMTVADLNSLDDGVDSTLHFHNSDRARANHTGTQTKSTISDFAHGASDHTGAIGTLSQISDVTVTAANLNAFLPSAGTTAGRPVAPAIGFSFFDTTIGKPVWFDGTNYVDATGTIA